MAKKISGLDDEKCFLVNTDTGSVTTFSTLAEARSGMQEHDDLKEQVEEGSYGTTFRLFKGVEIEFEAKSAGVIVTFKGE